MPRLYGERILLQEYWGKGYGKDAMNALINFAFLELNLNRLQLEVHDFNDRARRCYRACGFREEGKLREKQFKNGRYVDVIVMGLLRADWLAMRQRASLAQQGKPD